MPLNWTRSATAIGSALVIALGATVIAQRTESGDEAFSAERLQRVGELIDHRIAAREIPGAVTLVAHNGRIVHFEARGVTDLDSRRPMPKDAIFELASLTKPITTTAVLMLVEEGRLRLTDPVSQYIPEFRDQKVAVTPSQAVPVSRPITIRDLLTHTSGIVTAVRLPTDAAATLAGFIPTIGSEPLEFQPGTRWAYSNTVGFDTLARIVEVVSGAPYDRFLRQRIFEPLGMTSTSHVLTPAQKQRVATRYNIVGGTLRKNERPETAAYFGGGWGLNSTAGDYFRFAQMLLNGGELDGKQILSPRAVELMRSVHISDTLPGRQPGESWGLGVRVISDAAARNTWLSTGTFGWSGASGTHFWVDPKENLVAILMTGVPAVALKPDFETAVMQAVVKP
jgi:CubicO group peptidase (beta-lactamase class C family)